MAPFIEDGSIHLGPEGRARHPPSRPGLADARLGQAHIQVGAHGHFDQGRQGRIVKGGPPVHQLHRINIGFAGLGRGDDILTVPVGGNLGLRRVVIRAYGAARSGVAAYKRRQDSETLICLVILKIGPGLADRRPV